MSNGSAPNGPTRASRSMAWPTPHGSNGTSASSGSNDPEPVVRGAVDDGLRVAGDVAPVYVRADVWSGGRSAPVAFVAWPPPPHASVSVAMAATNAAPSRVPLVMVFLPVM